MRKPEQGIAMRVRARAIAVATSLLALSVTGCGSGLTAHPTPATTPTAASTPAPATATTPTTTRRVAPTQTAPVVSGTTFHVALSGAAPSRHSRPPSGSATIQVLTKLGEVCWTFKRISGVAHPTVAYIGDVTISGSPSGLRAPLPTSPEFLLGPHYTARGCIKLIASAIGEILSSPTGDDDIGIASGKHLNVIWGLL